MLAHLALLLSLSSHLSDMTAHNANSNPQPTLATLPTWLIAARRNMINTGFYLSDDSFCDKVAWAQEGHATHLSIKPETLDADNTSDGDSLKYPLPPPEGVNVAPICAVIKISDDDFWLTADAGYHGPLQIWKDFSDVKASCVTEQPDMAPFKDDYPIVVKNLHWLLDAVAAPKFSGKKGLSIWSSDTEADLDAHFKVCCKLFEVMSSISPGYQ
ncbi:hypothetical protein EDC04DRAFT_2611840 [Pisolithus marmoratus]|nr:hypothetical protein EDC04DRAFT_2611840 [Pisolithus marmoratus]